MVNPPKYAMRYGRTEPWKGTWVTPRQLEYLEAIETHWRKYMRAPTLREMAAQLGISHSAVTGMYERLKRRKLITQDYVSMRRAGTLRTSQLKVRVVKGGMMLAWNRGEL